MARGFNKVILMGNLARDPEVRYTVDKKAWVRFTVAVGYSWKDKNGEYQNSADFIPVVVWGSSLAERCGRYLKKGSAVLVEGRIKVSSFEAKDGSGKRFMTDVVATEVMFVGPKRTAEADEFSGGPPGESAPVESGGGSFPSFGEDANFGKSIREKGFGNMDFPMDFSELGDSDDGPEAEIPF